MHSYKFETPPGIAVDPEILTFFENFYRISDTPGDHDAYVANFTRDATVILASAVSHGYSQIFAAREGMWAHVTARTHTPAKIFPFGNDSHEFMLHGDVQSTFLDGRIGALPWAARAIMDRSTGQWRMGFYQVYLDTGAGI